MLQPWLHPDINVPEYILPLLEMNRDEKKLQITHWKIIKYHFYEGGDNNDNKNTYQISVFAKMPKVMMPYAIEWIRRGNSIRFAHMHKFC